MSEDNTSPEPITDETDVISSDGTEAASNAVKDILSNVLGKDFVSDEDAIKSVKDTYQYVGKAGKYQKAVEAVMTAKGLSEDNAVKFIMDSATKEPEETTGTAKDIVDGAPVRGNNNQDDSKFISREEFEEKTFYAENKEYEPYKELISALRKEKGLTSPSEVIELDSFKGIYEKAKAADEIEKSKSVLSTNPRLGQAVDRLTQAREASAAGKVATAASLVADSVIEAYEL
jgi:hypothetical protein